MEEEIFILENEILVLKKDKRKYSNIIINNKEEIEKLNEEILEKNIIIIKLSNQIKEMNNQQKNHKEEYENLVKENEIVKEDRVSSFKVLLQRFNHLDLNQTF